jgi:phosphoribosylformylglycinamidine synthase
VSKENLDAVLQEAKALRIAITELGTVSAGGIQVNGTDWGNISDWKNKYDTAIEKLLN